MAINVIKSQPRYFLFCLHIKTIMNSKVQILLWSVKSEVLVVKCTRVKSKYLRRVLISCFSPPLPRWAVVAAVLFGLLNFGHWCCWFLLSCHSENVFVLQEMDPYLKSTHGFQSRDLLQKTQCFCFWNVNALATGLFFKTWAMKRLFHWVWVSGFTHMKRMPLFCCNNWNEVSIQVTSSIDPTIGHNITRICFIVTKGNTLQSSKGQYWQILHYFFAFKLNKLERSKYHWLLLWRLITMNRFSSINESLWVWL